MPSTMLHAALITPLESLLNQLLTSDTVTGEALGRLSGSIIEIKAEDIDQSIFILPYLGGLQLQLDSEAPADVTLSGQSSTLFQLIRSKNKAEHFFGNGITVSGETALANQFQALIANTQIDWESLLATYLGDLPAHQLAEISRSKLGFIAQIGRSFGLNAKEYIQEELDILPTQAEIEGWMTESEATAESIERLTARIQRIEQRLNRLKKA